jgi:hypothetical protein
MKYVRMKPYNGRNHIAKTYTVFGIKFETAKGWYKVDDGIAEYLSGVKQITDGPDAEYSATTFDIVDSLADAKKIEAKEDDRNRKMSVHQGERKIRIHTPQAGRTTEMEVSTNLPGSKILKPSPQRVSSTKVDVPKWAHADRIVGRADFDAESEEWEDDMAPKASKRESTRAPEQRIDSDEDLGHDEGIEGGYAVPENAAEVQPRQSRMVKPGDLHEKGTREEVLPKDAAKNTQSPKEEPHKAGKDKK